MHLPVPAAFTLERDTSQADWLVARLKPWGTERVRVWSFVPDSFEAFARILHPAYRADRSTVRWSELAARSGVTLGPATGFGEVSGLDSNEPGWDNASPAEGTIEREQIEAIADLLAPFTGTPDRCWLAAWEGWGSWGPGSSTTLTATLGGPDDRRRRPLRWRTRRSVDRMVRESKRMLETIPRVTAEHRSYFLFRAQLRDISKFEVGGWSQAPSIWWPDDRTWCVATEVDGFSTYVGGSGECVEALIESERIEALAVAPDTPMDPGPH